MYDLSEEYYPEEVIYPPTPFEIANDDDMIEFCGTDEEMALEIVKEWLGITGDCDETNVKELFWDWLGDEDKARLVRSFIEDHRMEHDFNEWYRGINY